MKAFPESDKIQNDAPYVPDRRIAHLDMDAFFASVELLQFPELHGQAVVVGGGRDYCPTEHFEGRRFARLRDYAGRGVVTTSTYEARALGVFSGMGLMKSAQLAPDAVLLPANFDAYRHYSRLFKTAVAGIAPKIEDRGIDEIYIDLSGMEEDSVSLARRIQQAVFEMTGLTCSIGISPNKLLSKICSDLDKPNGITVLTNEEIRTRIWPLSVKEINGIGPKASEKLSGLGIHRIGDLAMAPVEKLTGCFGRAIGAWMHQAAHGIDNRPFQTEAEPKSIGRERTFARDLHAQMDKAELSEIFTALCVQIADDLRRRGYACRTVGIKLRYADFRSVTRDATLPTCIKEDTQIRKVAGSCLKRVSLDQRIRLLGVRASSLVPLAEAECNFNGIQAELPF